MASENTGNGKILSRRDALAQHGLRSGMGDWADVKPGETPSELPDIIKPFASALGLYDEEHDKRVQGLLEAQDSFNKGWRTGLQQLGKESVFAPAQPNLGELASLFGGQLPFQPASSQVIQPPSVTPVPPSLQSQVPFPNPVSRTMPVQNYQEDAIQPPMSVREMQRTGSYNPNAPMNSLQQGLLGQSMKGEIVLPGQGYVPPSVANKQMELAQPQVREVGGQLYQVTPEGARQIPGVQQQPKQLTNPVDQRVAVLSGGRYRTLGDALDAGQTALAQQAEKDVRETRPVLVAGATGAQAQTIAQQAPLPQGERKNLFDRKAWLQGEIKRLPAGTTKGQAALSDVIEVSDKQLDDFQLMQGSLESVRTLFDTADKVITAKTPLEAAKQYATLTATAFTRANPDAAAYAAAKDAFVTTTARQVGQERGVLTDRDVLRWAQVLPSFGDTVQTKERKRGIFNRILNATLEANRRIIAGDDQNTARKQAHNIIDPLLKQATTFKIKPDDRFNELKQSGMKDADIYKRMALEGY